MDNQCRCSLWEFIETLTEVEPEVVKNILNLLNQGKVFSLLKKLMQEKGRDPSLVDSVEEKLRGILNSTRNGGENLAT